MRPRPGNVCKCASLLVKLFDMPSKNDLQVAWMKILLREGKFDAVKTMDSVCKALLDSQASSFLRAMTVMLSLQEGKAAETLDVQTQAGRKEAITQYAQIATFNLQEIPSDVNGLGDCAKLIETVVKAAEDALGVIADGLSAEKEQVQATYKKYQPIVQGVMDWDEAKPSIAKL